jgi:hypothetical protein
MALFKGKKEIVNDQTGAATTVKSSFKLFGKRVQPVIEPNISEVSEIVDDIPKINKEDPSRFMPFHQQDEPVDEVNVEKLQEDTEISTEDYSRFMPHQTENSLIQQGVSETENKETLIDKEDHRRFMPN